MKSPRRRVLPILLILPIAFVANVASAQLNVIALDRYVNAAVQSVDDPGIVDTEGFVSEELGLFDHLVDASLVGTSESWQTSDLEITANGCVFGGTFGSHEWNTIPGVSERYVGTSFAIFQFEIAIAATFTIDVWNVSDALPGELTLRDVYGEVDLVSEVIGTHATLTGTLEADERYVLTYWSATVLVQDAPFDHLCHFDTEFRLEFAAVAAAPTSWSRVKKLFD